MKEEHLTKRRRFTQEERKRILMKTGCKCGHCGKKQEVFETTIDHIIPLNKGGLNDEYNLIALCEKCNERKANFLYGIMDYYKYILPEYKNQYCLYHNFAMYDKRHASLFGHDAHKYTIYPEKQKMIIQQMARRGASNAKIKSMMNKIGVPLYLTKAYAGDADEIMELINFCIGNKGIQINSSYYQNDYAVANDIQNGEVYVLRSNVNGKISGAFLFKKINDETLPFVQIRNIIDSSSFHAKYIMTGAFVDFFAREAFNDIMVDVVRNMISNRAIPIFFNMLHCMFADANECISIPYELDKQNGTIDFMPMKYIRKTTKEDCRLVAEYYEEELSESELDVFADSVLSYSKQKELDDADEETKELFKKHASLKGVFRPDEYELYAKGF